RAPWLLHLGAWYVLAFELSFPLLVLFRRTRAWAALFGLLFHALAAVFLVIPFVGLWSLYVVLVDPRRIWERARIYLRPRQRTEPVAVAESDGALASRWTNAVGSLLVLGAVAQGARGQMRSFPFACYPTFEWIAGPEMPDLVIEAQTADGKT